MLFVNYNYFYSALWSVVFLPNTWNILELADLNRGRASVNRRQNIQITIAS